MILGEGDRASIRPSIAGEEYQDFAELIRASDPIAYAFVAAVQEIRRHPRLQKAIEATGKKIFKTDFDLTRRLT